MSGPARVNARVLIEVEEETTIPGLPPHLHVIQRCNRWGTFILWQEYTGLQDSRPKAIRSWWGPLILDRNVAPNHTWEARRDPCPVDVQEVLETAEAVRRLPDVLRDVLTIEHTCSGTQEHKAMVLHISRTTYWRRCQSGYGLLMGLMNDVAAGL